MPTGKIKRKNSNRKIASKKDSLASQRYSGKLRKIIYMLAIPAVVYFIFFCLFTWPWITHFNGWFFTDSGDGLQNVWNVWWVNKSVTQFHQLPWHTTYLHVPYGVTLLGQTLNPLNGFAAIVLLKFLSLNQAFNVMVIFSFVFGGVTAFWLAHYFTKKYIPSLIAGFIFTFSSYHFAHAIGHMQLVSLEFIPLFILLWWKLLKKPTYWLAAGASFTLLLVILCDYYYFLYSVFTALGIAFYLWRKKELADFRKKENYLPAGLFTLLSGLFVAPIPAALILYNSRDTLTGSHPARLFSTDIFTPFINGGFWRFSSLTRFYWKNIHAFVSESSIYLGLSALALLVYSVVKRRVLNKDLIFWQVLIVVFAIFSLGPRLKVFGYSINHAPMPYVILEKIIPGLKLSGVPIRMMVMVTLGVAIISAMVLAKVDLHNKRGRLIVAAFFVLFSFEMFPQALPLTPNSQPKYVAALKKLPSTGAVLDNGAISESFQLYHQTLHEKPMILGYISRTPQSLVTKEAILISKVNPGHYGQLCSEYKLRYITTPRKKPLHIDFPIVYQDSDAIIYDIKNNPGC